MAKVLLHGGAAIDRKQERGREKAHRIAARDLSLVPGDVGPLEHSSGVLRAIPKDCNADAESNAVLVSSEKIWHLSRGEKSGCDGFGMLRGHVGEAAKGIEQYDKLVGAEARNGVLFMDRGRKTVERTFWRSRSPV